MRREEVGKEGGRRGGRMGRGRKERRELKEKR